MNPADQRAPLVEAQHAGQHVIAHRLHELSHFGKGARQDQPADRRHHGTAEALHDPAHHEGRQCLR